MLLAQTFMTLIVMATGLPAKVDAGLLPSRLQG